MTPPTRPVVVVKCGGAVSHEPAQLAGDVAVLRAAGNDVIVVHGGAPDIARLAGQLGVPEPTLLAPDGRVSRYTHAAMIDVVTLALAGRVKPRIVAALAVAGLPAIGLTGVDAGLVQAVRKPARRAVRDGRVVLVRDDLSGRIVAVDPQVLRAVLAIGITPVVSPPAAGPDGQALNVDADRVAAGIAASMSADHLLFLTAAAGVLRDPDDEATVLGRQVLDPDAAIGEPFLGGMHRKLVAAREALRAGVPHVVVADGRIDSPVLAALRGRGTSISLATPPR